MEREEPRLSELYTLAAAAALVKVPKQTLHDAAKRSDFPTYQTACGLSLVSATDVKAWAKNRPSRGRKPSQG